jgi:hypothetical protein
VDAKYSYRAARKGNTNGRANAARCCFTSPSSARRDLIILAFPVSVNRVVELASLASQRIKEVSNYGNDAAHGLDGPPGRGVINRRAHFDRGPAPRARMDRLSRLKLIRWLSFTRLDLVAVGQVAASFFHRWLGGCVLRSLPMGVGAEIHEADGGGDVN